MTFLLSLRISALNIISSTAESVLRFFTFHYQTIIFLLHSCWSSFMRWTGLNLEGTTFADAASNRHGRTIFFSSTEADLLPRARALTTARKRSILAYSFFAVLVLSTCYQLAITLLMFTVEYAPNQTSSGHDENMPLTLETLFAASSENRQGTIMHQNRRILNSPFQEEPSSHDHGSKNQHIVSWLDINETKSNNGNNNEMISDTNSDDNIIPSLSLSTSTKLNESTTTKRKTELLPEQVMAQYIQWHSQDALERYGLLNRTFVIGFYSCPLQAGNRLTHFFNSLKWAMITNRTLLWKYNDQQTCRDNLEAEEERFQNETNVICPWANTEEDCAQVLHRATWIPSYEDWKNRLVSMFGPPERIPYWKSSKQNDMAQQVIESIWALNITRREQRRLIRKERKAGTLSWINKTLDKDSQSRPLVIFPIQVGLDRVLADPNEQHKLLNTKTARTTVTYLYKEGVHFLFGMMFRKTFSLALPPSSSSSFYPYRHYQMSLSEQNERQHNQHMLSHDDVFSIGMHSRHSSTDVIGRDIQSLKACFNSILHKNLTLTDSSKSTSDNTKNKKRCVALLMSDRDVTLAKTRHWLREQWNCTVHIANHTTGSSFSSEHGPFAGTGFFQDLELVVHARDAFIAGNTKASSSTDLILSIIEYDRTMEAWRDGRVKKPMKLCNVW